MLWATPIKNFFAFAFGAGLPLDHDGRHVDDGGLGDDLNASGPPPFTSSSMCSDDGLGVARGVPGVGEGGSDGAGAMCMSTCDAPACQDQAGVGRTMNERWG